MKQQGQLLESATSNANAKFLYPIPAAYTNRAGKAIYIATKYASILGGSVLDVGCDEKQLSKLIPSTATYLGIDMSSAADIILILEDAKLPLADRAIDTVLACDVLEHLEQIHAVFDELCRVAKHRVIVSLPNPMLAFMHALAHEDIGEREGTNKGLKYYGLPVERPRDRHRWFFSSEEAQRFVRERGKLNAMRIEQLDFEAYPEPPPYFSRSGRVLSNSPTFSQGTMWAVLSRT